MESLLRGTINQPMHSYDEIKAHLERQLTEAMACHHEEALDRNRTAAAVARAQARLENFTLHGLIPEELSEDIIGGGS